VSVDLLNVVEPDTRIVVEYRFVTRVTSGMLSFSFLTPELTENNKENPKKGHNSSANDFRSEGFP